MRYLSVCSGIEAATVAWHPLGWEPAAFSEIEAFPRAVLAHHYPGVPLHGDFTTIRGDEYGPVGLLVGGTPCQSFSVAGLRKGMADPRGNLALGYLGLAERLGARWLVWENVPGVLSSNGGRDFGAFLGGLAELGYGFAYRVLDAQYFGVPQRRRRVFVVGHLGDWRPAAAVLFERHSLSGHSPPSREAGERTAPTLAARTRGGGGLGTDFDCDGGLVTGFDPYNTCATGDITCTLAGQDAGNRMPHIFGFGWQNAAAQGDDVREELAPTLDKSKTPAVCLPFDTTQITSAANRSNPKPGDPCHPLAAGAHAPAVAYALGSHAGVADGEISNQSHASGGPVGSNISEELAYSLRAGRQQSIAARMAVRRITPREAEALQGFKQDYTLVPYRGKPAADGPRYKALGNSMAVPVMAWIGQRIAAVEEILSTSASERAA